MEEPTEMVETATETAQDAAETGKDGKPFDADRAQALIDKQREELKAAKAVAKRLAELEAQEAKRKEADMSELEKLTKKATELEAKLKAAEVREMRNKVGTQYKLPAEIAELLQGEDETEMKAHAEKLAHALPKPATLTPTNPAQNDQAITDAQRRAFLFGGAPLPK